MVKMNRLGTVVVFLVIAICQAQGQSSGNNIPKNELWPIFSQLLSAQTGRSIQDINILGLSDPTIKQLWTSYTATLAKMTQTPAPAQTTTSTTPPPLPDLYQSSYSFSSNSNQAASSNQGAANSNQGTSSSSSSSSSALNSLSYNDILSLINQLSSRGSAAASPSNTPTNSVTTAQDVMNAYGQLPGNSVSSGSNPSQGSSGSSGTDYQALLQKYMTSMAGALPTSSTNSNPSSQSQVDQGTSSASTSSGSASYEQLLQQYNQIMGKSSGSSTNANSGSSSSSMVDQYLALTSKSGSGAATANDKLQQMYNLLSGGKAAAAESTTTAPALTSASPQDTFEKQLATFFPQFKSLFPQNASSSSGGAASANTDPAQMIFDALLFTQSKPAPAVAASGASSGAPSPAAASASNTSAPAAPVDNSPLSYIQNMVNSKGGSDAILSNHVQNVFKTRASREMGCRFLPELLELDLLPTAPVNCMNRCPFPYVNSQQFGIYCVCCPPGVNEQTVGMVSLMRGTSYMETPLSVVS